MKKNWQLLNVEEAAAWSAVPEAAKAGTVFLWSVDAFAIFLFPVHVLPLLFAPCCCLAEPARAIALEGVLVPAGALVVSPCEAGREMGGSVGMSIACASPVLRECCVAGIVLTRAGYYTIPSLEELARLTNDRKECIVTDFTIGRRGELLSFLGLLELQGLIHTSSGWHRCPCFGSSLHQHFRIKSIQVSQTGLVWEGR